MIHREARLPVWGAGAAAFVCFCLLVCIACLLELPLLDYSSQYPLFPAYEATLAACAIVNVVCSYLVSRKLYRTLRWRTFEDDAPRCTSCGYNLTGNVTGICSECGEPI